LNAWGNPILAPIALNLKDDFEAVVIRNSSTSVKSGHEIKKGKWWR